MDDEAELHSAIRASMYAIAGELQRDAAEVGTEFISEADLKAATRRALQAQLGRAIRPESPVSGRDGWPKKGLGAFDVGLYDGERLIGAFELKWCRGNKLGEALWDTLKLLPYTCGATPLTGAYLIYGAPVTYWTHPAAPAFLFADGSHDLAQLLSDYSQHWKSALAGNRTARPRYLTAVFDTKHVAAVPILSPTNLEWEIRCARISGNHGETVHFDDDGWPVGHQSNRGDSTALRADSDQSQ